MKETKARLSVIIYISLVLIPFFASFSSRAVNLFIAIAILAFCVKHAVSKSFGTIGKNPILLPFLALILVSLVSFLDSVSLRASLQGIGKLVKYLALVLILPEEIKDAQHVKRIVTAILLGLLLASLDGLYQLYTGFDFIRHYTVTLRDAGKIQLNLPRLTAAFRHTNMFGIYLGVFLPLSMSVTLYHYQGRQKLFGFTTSTLALFCLLCTFSRGAFAGLLVALMLIGVMKRDKMIFASLFLMIVILPFALPQPIKEWRKQTPSFWESILDTQKIADYRNALNMIRHHPWTGVGVNTYTLNFEKYKLKDNSRFVSDTGWSHNSYLQMAAEIGIFGPLVFFWLVFRLFKSGIRSYKGLEENFLKAATMGVLAGILAFLVNGITETALYYSKMASLFWFQVGFLLAISRMARAREILKR